MSLHCHHRPSRGPPGAFAARCVVHRARRGECHGRKEARGKSRGRPSQPPPRPSSRGSCADARGPACTTGCPWAQPAAQWWSADCRCPRRRSIAPQPESVPHFPGQPCQRLRPQSVRSKLEKKPSPRSYRQSKCSGVLCRAWSKAMCSGKDDQSIVIWRKEQVGGEPWQLGDHIRRAKHQPQTQVAPWLCPSS